MKIHFLEIRTIDDQIQLLIKYCGYIEAEEIPLGRRIDYVLDKKSCSQVPKLVLETCQYVPIIKSLKLVLSNKVIRDALLQVKTSPPRILGSFVDGQHFKSHQLFSRYPHALRLKLYYDELEITNSLGSKTGIHKLRTLYFQIQNLPLHMNSSLNSIHTLIICCDADVKKYGFKKILEPFVVDLLKLESDEEVVIQLDGEEFTLRASISAFCGDGLAIHQVFNLLSLSANLFCRCCMYSRENFHNVSMIPAAERTKDLFEEHLFILEANNYSDHSMKITGIKEDSCLNESRYFHISRNKIFDPFHDFLQGICPMILKLVLKKYISLGYFDLTYFNGKIAAFSYGYVEKKINHLITSPVLYYKKGIIL